MVKRLYLHGAGSHEIGVLNLIPQAILRKSVEDISEEYGIRFDDDQDDLDTYKVAYFETDGVVLAMMRHQGEPGDNVNFYLPRNMREQDARKLATDVLRSFSIPTDLLEWLS